MLHHVVSFQGPAMLAATISSPLLTVKSDPITGKQQQEAFSGEFLLFNISPAEGRTSLLYTLHRGTKTSELPRKNETTSEIT